MRITISDSTRNILDREVPDHPRLAEFGKLKKSLLDMLRNVSARGPKSKPFDEKKAWRSLVSFANAYLVGSAKKATIPAADRIERLRDIASMVRRAHRLIERTMQNDAGVDLFEAWWEVAGSEFAKEDGSFDPSFMKRKFENLVEGLAVLETAASRAAHDVVHAKRGRRAVLSVDDIWNLASLYRDSTGSIPGAGAGPFAKFVEEVLIATGRRDKIESESIIEAIKHARRWAHTHPVALKWGPSPFDEEA